MKALWTLWKALTHTTALCALPFLVGGITAYFVDVYEVTETLGELVRFCGFLLFPIMLLQLAGIAQKTRREVAVGRESGRPIGWIEASYRHAKVLTGKGYFLLLVSLGALICALAIKWAQFGVMCVLGLTLVYVASTVGIVVSAFFVGDFAQKTAARRGRVSREMSPAVVSRGDEVEERFQLERVPVPFGFHLVIEDQLHHRLETESRHVASSNVSSRAVTLSGPVRRTPRGVFAIGPAQIWYQDILGLTRVAVAQAAHTTLKVLPRFRPVAIGDPPRSRSKDEDVLTIVSRMPTEDLFRFREYMPRDDTRRINWKLSMKVGRLHIRVPESVPVSRRRVRLVVDSFLPPGLANAQGPLEDVLDDLVEAWISLAKALVERGEQVTLVCAAARPGKPLALEELRCKRGSHLLWADLGSAVTWQSQLDLDAMLVDSDSGRSAKDAAEPVVVTTRFCRLPDIGGRRVTWVYLPPSRHPAPVSGDGMKAFFLLPFPTGADENSFAESLKRARLRGKRQRLEEWADRAVESGARAAEAQIRGRSEPVYRLQSHGITYTLTA
ncbi:MAG: DUF58 domain-containing protein [Deltaproteobacteria bacterium]|nr:DUF58 domain-containing protein [Deltaproteobacteria bacterium]